MSWDRNESCKAKGGEGVFKGLLVVDADGNKRTCERFKNMRSCEPANAEGDGYWFEGGEKRVGTPGPARILDTVSLWHAQPCGGFV